MRRHVLLAATVLLAASPAAADPSGLPLSKPDDGSRGCPATFPMSPGCEAEAGRAGGIWAHPRGPRGAGVPLPGLPPWMRAWLPVGEPVTGRGPTLDPGIGNGPPDVPIAR